MSNKLIFVFISVLLVLMVGLAGGLFIMWNKLASITPPRDAAASAETAEDAAAALGPIFSLDTFIVNLADEERTRYLRITMNLELTEKSDSDRINQRLPQVRDSILLILPTKRMQEISSVAGKTNLRDELIARLNSIFNEEVVSNIFFTEFVVQ